MKIQTWWRRTRARLGDDRGSTPIELAIVAPAVLLLVLGAIQVCLIFHANTLAHAAAQQGVDAARAYQAGTDAGTQRAQQFLDQAGGDFLHDTSVSTSSNGSQIEVVVQATPLSILPGHWFAISQTVSGPREIVTTP
ncbi:MAG: pilus assembly protein [Kribbellaceae bacterium]|nr:pilus assembly protein [Kribbellaceae bacterium]